MKLQLYLYLPSVPAQHVTGQSIKEQSSLHKCLLITNPSREVPQHKVKSYLGRFHSFTGHEGP